MNELIKTFDSTLSSSHYILKMQWLSLISMIILIQFSIGKDTALYQVSGVELIDLLRGFKPEENMLKLTKVNGDKMNLPDGVYYQPEDEALTGDTEYLHLNVRVCYIIFI